MFIGVYVPPADSSYYVGKERDSNLQLVQDYIMSLYEQDEDVHIMLCGDLNAHIGKWDGNTDVDMVSDSDQDDFCRKSKDTVINRFGRLLIDICRFFQCTPLNGWFGGDKMG
ncbi:hypothetical protein BaRGS_00027296 [Batillaria attramentaria]|uniref:Endonuclease/exonuclease/phosphatase domain-containing protein n=1 Tax=Batillaria attramentaria TaxID=370345 RepID=A0ABD0K208_9CAEN